MKHGCIFSPCRRYRYTLWRQWGDMFTPDLGYVQFIGLNPSTADENVDDPTVRRCIGYAKTLGYARFCMTNLFAFRATDPNVMMRELEPVGPENDHHLRAIAENAALVICAWGNHGGHKDRCHDVERALSMKLEIPLYRLGSLTDEGFPRHPLYLSKDLKPIPL